jgi:hypothetical protein
MTGQTRAGRRRKGVAREIALVLGLAGIAPGAGAAGRTLTVDNHSRQPINQLYVSPAEADQWGEDRLGDQDLMPGRSVRVDLGRARSCAFDVQIVYDDASREERHGVDVCHRPAIAFDGSGATPPPSATTHQVTVANRSPRPIQQLFISPSVASDWGEDRLAHRALSVGESVTVPYRGDCVADLRVVFDNRSAEERREIDVCTSGAIAISPGWDTADTLPAGQAPVGQALLLRVVNRSSQRVTALFIFPEGEAERGPDLLGSLGLESGAEVAVRLQRPPGVCRFAARVSFAAKAPDRELTGLDLCRSTELTIPPHR